MQKMTAEDLKNLQWGDKVYRFNGESFRGFRFVGKMPGCTNYLIFSDGEYLTHLHISDKTNEYSHDWYMGKYDSKFVGNLLLDKAQRRIETIKQVYFKEE